MYYLILCLAYCLSKLKAQHCFALGRGLGWLASNFLPIRRTIVESNIDRVFGARPIKTDKKRLVLESYQTLATVGLETLRLKFTSKEEVLQRTQLTGAVHLDTALSVKRGVIVASGHFRDIVFSGCTEAARGVPVYVIAKRVEEQSGAKDLPRDDAPIWDYANQHPSLKVPSSRHSRKRCRGLWHGD